MSAFMVSPGCIHRVVFGMRATRPEYLRVDSDLHGMMLLEMNRRALIACYGDNSVEAIEPYRYVQPASHPHLLMQVYKSLRCYLYQCSEGDVPDFPLYLQLVGVRDMMATTFGYDHKRDTWRRLDLKTVYDQCEWG